MVTNAQETCEGCQLGLRRTQTDVQHNMALPSDGQRQLLGPCTGLIGRVRGTHVTRMKDATIERNDHGI